MGNTDTWRRSRSPRHHKHRVRSRDEDPGRTRQKRPRHDLTHSSMEPSLPLPFGAKALSKHDFAASQSLFEYYLEIQKGLIIGNLDEGEVRGRWKSFIGKW